jgi:putative flavoprotein involved in K+ transport
LSVGYCLAQHGLSFVILDGSARVGDAWRHRWDSLRLFTPAKYDGLAGMPFPGDPNAFPTKNDMADYLEEYARHFHLPVRLETTVSRLSRTGSTYTVESAGRRYEAEHVVVAMASYQQPRLPAFASMLDSSIVQLTSKEYKNPGQLQPGDVLLVGAGNSGADIALDVAPSHRTFLSGRHPGNVPFKIDGAAARALLPLLFRVVFHRILTVDNPFGRRARRKMISMGAPLIRVKPADLERAGVERVGRVAGVDNGRPRLGDGRVLDVRNVIWCTGFNPGFSWMDLPVAGLAEGEPQQSRGVVSTEPGLYFVGLHFLYSFSSTMIHGIERDARHVADTIHERLSASAAAPARASRWAANMKSAKVHPG